ncbi:olfactory receptor 15 [Sigmodon hispidus]
MKLSEKLANISNKRMLFFCQMYKMEGPFRTVINLKVAKKHQPLTVFILAGLTDAPGLQLSLFFLFLGIYAVTMVGNLGMITLILLSSHLHSPMYFFLSSLSFIDLCHSTVITPKMLVNFVTMKNIISYPECMTQLYFFLVFVISECHMLAAMAYDRYVAICNPLLYNAIMSYQVCSWMIFGVYSMGLIGATAHTVCMLRVHFCKADVINHYFCDLFPLLELSCSSTFINEVVVLCFSAFNILFPTLSILSSYIFIIANILRIKSTEGRSKAFSTCSSHIAAVTVFFGSAAFMYLQPSSVSSMDQGKVSSVFYTIVVPMLNPVIYSLRNKDVKIALRKLTVSRFFISQERSFRKLSESASRKIREKQLAPSPCASEAFPGSTPWAPARTALLSKHPF